MNYRIDLAKEDFKFSGAHFTIFTQDQAERLHGHNYYVNCQIEMDRVHPQLGLTIDFKEIKTQLREITAQLDEYVLLAANSPWLKFADKGENIRVSFAKKVYEFPKSDVRLLPICNVTSEELARWIGEELIKKLDPSTKLTSLAIGVEETRGQSTTWQHAF